MIKRVAEAIKQACEHPRYVVKIAHGKSLEPWQLWDVPFIKLIKSSNLHSVIDDLCERMNYEHMAFKAIEALKGDIPVEVHNAYRCEELWKDLNSHKVLALWLDAILLAKSESEHNP